MGGLDVPSNLCCSIAEAGTPKPAVPAKKLQYFIIEKLILQKKAHTPPEDIFDLGNYTKLSEYTDGNFFSEYDKMLSELQFRVCKYGLGSDCICTPIKSLYERIADD